jgi:catechol 2,3-dioxygenase-like lactoylglutathione lyase family enzyme
VSRVQLALNVDDVDAAVAFYSRLFQAEPAKRRPGYANFALDDPALKLVLIERPGAGGSVNHLGVEVGSAQEVVAATRRLTAAGLPTAVE